MTKKTELEDRLRQVKIYLAKGLSIKDISKLTNTPEPTIERDIRRIRDQIKAELKPSDLVENVIYQIGLQTDVLASSYWTIYYTASSDNAKVGALNGLTKLIGDKIQMLQRIGVLDSTIKVDVKGSVQQFVEYMDKNREKFLKDVESATNRGDSKQPVPQRQ